MSIYDPWFLLGKGTTVEKELINKKLADFDLAKEIEKERKKWGTGMSLLTKTLHSFDEAKETILTALKR